MKRRRRRQARLPFPDPNRLAGVDEAGRGPLAGPVVAAAVILDRRRPIRGLADSKVLEPEVREKLAVKIRERALAWAVAWADREEVDTLNILQATLLAMRRALLGLRIAPDEVRIDGDRCPSLDGLAFACPAVPIVQGDALVPAISAASILAKTYRDAWMRSFHEIWPDYGFASHKGYATPEHLRGAGVPRGLSLAPPFIHAGQGNDRMVVRGVPVRTRGRRGGSASYNRARPTADPSMSQFVHLRVHTEYSLLDSVVRVPELIDATVAAGMPAVALTDQTTCSRW